VIYLSDHNIDAETWDSKKYAIQKFSRLKKATLTNMTMLGGNGYFKRAWKKIRPENQTNEIRSAKLPDFWRKSKLWFAMLEHEFAEHSILR